MIICLVILIPYVYMSSLVTDLQIDTCIFSNNAYPIHIFNCFLCCFQQLYACCIYNYFLFLTVIMPVLLADMICLRDKTEFLNPDSFFFPLSDLMRLKLASRFLKLYLPFSSEFFFFFLH